MAFLNTNYYPIMTSIVRSGEPYKTQCALTAVFFFFNFSPSSPNNYLPKNKTQGGISDLQLLNKKIKSEVAVPTLPLALTSANQIFKAEKQPYVLSCFLPTF